MRRMSLQMLWNHSLVMYLAFKVDDSFVLVRISQIFLSLFWFLNLCWHFDGREFKKTSFTCVLTNREPVKSWRHFSGLWLATQHYTFTAWHSVFPKFMPNVTEWLILGLLKYIHEFQNCTNNSKMSTKSEFSEITLKFQLNPPNPVLVTVCKPVHNFEEVLRLSASI